MMKHIRRNANAFLLPIVVIAGTLGLSATAHSQKGVRVGVSISGPIRPMDDSSKSFAIAVLILTLIIVGVAFALWVLFHALLTGEKVWNKLCHYSSDQREKQKQTKREQDQIEHRQEQLGYRQRWEEITEKAYRETVKEEARMIAEKE